jgi:hypothetical protein
MSEPFEPTRSVPKHADRRVHARHRIRALAYVELGESNGGIVLNIGEGGFAVRAAEPINEDGMSRLRFQMQHAKQPLEMSGKIAWTSESKREAGVRFTDVREESLLEIRTWIFQGVSPEKLPKQPATERKAFKENRGKESIPDVFAGDDAAEAQTRNNGDDLPATPPVISYSKREFSGLKEPAEMQRHARTLFPKEAITVPSVRLPVTASPAIKKSAHVPPVNEREGAQENWMDFRIQMGRGWVVAALVTFLVAVSFAGGMAVRKGGLLELWRDANVTPSASSQTQSSVPVAPLAKLPSKPLQIEIVDSSNQRWVIPASVHSGVNGAGITSGGVSRGPSESIAASSSVSSPTAARPDASDASALSAQKGTAPLLLSLPERSLSASGLVAISSQRSFAVPAGSSQGTSQPGKNLQVGQLANLVDPVYPPDAEQKHIEGTVKLHAIIAVDGSIKDLQPLGGPPALLPAALTAVREWRYNPTILNGQPIETQEDISLVFRLPN